MHYKAELTLFIIGHISLCRSDNMLQVEKQPSCSQVFIINIPEHY